MKQNNKSKNKSCNLAIKIWSIDIIYMFSVGMWSSILCILLFMQSAKREDGIGQDIVLDQHNYSYSNMLFWHPTTGTCCL